MSKSKNSTYGRTVTVKHYLNKRVKPEIDDEDNERKAYPVYVRITAKQQTTDFRSAYEEYVFEDSFDDVLKEEKAWFDNEVNSIKRIIDHEGFFENPFAKIKDINFWIIFGKTATELIYGALDREFEAVFYEISGDLISSNALVDDLLELSSDRKDVGLAFKKKYGDMTETHSKVTDTMFVEYYAREAAKEFFNLNTLYPFPPYVFYGHLLAGHSLHFKKLLEDYTADFLNFSIYNDFIIEQDDNLKDFTLTDLLDGTFEKEFLKYLPHKTLTLSNIKKGINSLISNHPYLIDVNKKILIKF